MNKKIIKSNLSKILKPELKNLLKYNSVVDAWLEDIREAEAVTGCRGSFEVKAIYTKTNKPETIKIKQ